MDDERRRRFKTWYGATYGSGKEARAKFMADSGKLTGDPITKGRVTQLFDDNEPFGELAAKNLAARFGLPDDFFLNDVPGTNSVMTDLEDIRRVNPDTYGRVIADIALIAVGSRASNRVLREKAMQHANPTNDHTPAAEPVTGTRQLPQVLMRGTSGFGDMSDSIPPNKPLPRRRGTKT